MSELTAYLNEQKRSFLLEQKQTGGKARAFRAYVGTKYQADPGFFVKLVLDAVMEAATKTWERQPRRRGPDLFAIAGYTIPEFLTGPAKGYIDADDPDDDAEVYEKVAYEYATLQDLLDDAMIKFRKAAQASAAAEDAMKAVDEARRRARGDMTVFLLEIADAASTDGRNPSPSHPDP
ncbi:MAG TPA: hypothetical protein VEU08_18830 [Vicinamibacterales bacterium]|nr:hypothetical protein [Vicinamibacterales bacterium]